MVNGRSQTQRVHAVRNVQEVESTGDGNQYSDYLCGVWGGRGQLTCEGHKGAPWGARNVLDLDLGVGHMAYTSVKLRTEHFYTLLLCVCVCVLHLSKKQ